ncbi:hypothetical protein JG688_00002168 [Phytophthora aleatoria]|uniref:DnaJ homologue subfamily C GRV2/DNAJC13 N-terminal domain-containing protein n=1 Tax=Phytophthora aleatoria TaxID=2496075 RepID=A0A8J5JB63_9STRA|nr:hypothetical protein JG688_00002168 [Phytophthora aleatoria]
MALPRGDDSGDAELQQLKQRLDPVAFGHDVVSLDERFVPRGPETTGFEVEPRPSSFYGALPVPSGAEEDDDDEDDMESIEVPVNRYAGVIYAARFFVTRVGFLRSAKRLLVLSSNHLTIVDPYSDEVKERYAFDNIKEITIASDSGGHNADRAFTIFIGKNLKETYTKDEIEAATADALSAVGASVGTSDNSWATGSGGPGGSNSNLLGSGMYFDIKVEVLLAVRAASLDRLDPQTRTTLSSILLIDIVKIQRVNTNSNELVLYFENNRVHRYWCDSREPFIQALANNLRSWLSVSLFVEEVSDSCEFDALTSTRDIPQPVTFEMPVLKISKNKSDKLQLRLLGLTALAIIERDPVTRKTLASHSLNDIFNVVMYPSVSSAQDDPDSESSEGLSGKFALELKHGLTRRYICLSSAVSRRDKKVSLGLTRVSSQHEKELRQLIGDIAGDIDVPEWLNVAGSTSLLSPKEARSLFLSNMIEMCRMNKLHVPWSTEETKIACKEGTWGTEVHPEWEDILLRKLVNLNFIPNLVTNESMSLIYHQLVQFNRNIPLGGLRQRDRRAFASLMKVLENFKEYSVAQLNSPSNTDAPIPTTEFQVELLLAIQRLLCTRGVFEEIPSSQYKNSIEVIMELLHSPMEEVSFAAACVIKYMVVNYSDTRSLKSETANRRAIFTKYHSRMYVSRAFDLSRTNRVGRVPLHSTSSVKPGSTHGFPSVAAMSNTERSMANALAYSQLGLDYLVLVMVLQTLEVCLSSGKKATPERVARDLLRAMRVDDFSRHHALFLFNRSLSFSITKCSSILVKVHILEQPTELVELIQDFSRKHGALVWQLYLALYTQDKAQRRISSQLVALLTHENPRSSYVIRNIFPHALLDDQKTSQLEYDEFGRHLPTANPELYAKGHGNSHKNGNRRDLTNATESGRSKLSYGINTRARLARNVKHAVLLPEFFDRLGKTYATKDFVWGPNAVEELIRKLQAEMSALDMYRLKYLGYLYTDPLATDHTETEWDAYQANRLRHDPQHANFAPFLFEFLQHGSEIGTHEDFRNAALAKKKKKSAKNMPRWFVAWNCNEFRIDYECLESEVKVGPYYLANILDDRGVLVEDIEGAEKFMTLLYYRLLAEDRSISTKKLQNGERYSSADSLGDVDQSDIRLLVLKVMIQLYERHFNELGSLVFLNHFLRVSMMISKDGEDRRWPLVVRGNIMLFLDRVLSSAINVSRFLREEDNVTMTCLSVLSRLIDCHTAEEEGHMYQDIRFPKYGRLTHFEGSGVSPISSIKRRLCEDQTLRFLVGLLDCPNRIVFKKCLGLIRLLVRHNEAIIPNLHASGIFYYLLRFSQDVDEMSIAARLISHIHLRQSGLDVPHLIDDKQKGENKKGVFSPDPLTRICLRSWLVRLLPVSMVAQLLRHGPRRFATALFSDANNPEVVWNANMRSQMVSYIEKFMELHTDENGMFYISENEGSEHKACIALIQYPKEVHALQCYQYYLHNLLDEKNFPGWPINDEAAFLRALLDSIRRWVHPGLLLTARGAQASEGQSTKLLSVSDAVELLDATALLLRRVPDSPTITNLPNFSYFLEALERCITELKDNRVGPTKTFFDVSNAIATKTAFVRAFGSAIRVINLAVSISDENAHECSSGLGLRVLCNSLQLLFHNQEALSTIDGCTPNVMTHWVLEALVNVLNQPNGRVSAAAQSIDLLPCLTRFLSQEGDRLATDLSLQIVYEMAGSSGEMAEVLLLQLAEHGILWYLTLLLFHYQPNNDDSDGDMQRISIGAAKALGRILEANAREESIAVFVKRMQTTIEQVFTRPLVDILRRAGPIKMLDVLATEVREPHVMWTERMRKELISLAQRAIQFHTTLDQSDEDVHKVFELPPYFMYTAQKEELCVAGIYVNFFNENPKDGILAQIAGTVNGNGNRMDMFKSKPTTKKEIQAAAAAAAELENRTVSGHVMHGLLAALSYDISGVRAQPQALESVLLQRLLPIATAIRNLLQYTPDMDVQVVQTDGLLTLLFVLDHETQPQGFSFANAPLLLLRCMECVHMLSFSGKCVDPLATVVPPFIKSAFQVVYKNLARTEASTEGQLARVTLQLLGNLCLIPACIDNLVKGMDPASLSNLLPHVWLGDSTEMQLLLCLHMIPLKRHTQAATEFAKAAVSSQLAAALLNLLSTLVPKSKMGESTATKQYAARFLSVLSSNPGSGGAISSLLIASRVWETHGDTTQATSEDLRRLLVPPHAPALLKAPHANPNKVG